MQANAEVLQDIETALSLIAYLKSQELDDYSRRNRSGPHRGRAMLARSDTGLKIRAGAKYEET